MTCNDCKFYEKECEAHFQQELMGLKRSMETCEIFCPKIICIDRNALIEDLEAAKNNGGMSALVASTLIRYVKRCPTVDAVEVVHGQWEAAGFDGHGDYKECCSNCKAWSIGSDKLFCPVCGAKMDGGADDGC